MVSPVSPAIRPFRVLLVNLNSYDQPYPVYPLGLAYIDGALLEAGHQTRIWDAHLAPDGLALAIAEFEPDLVGLSMRNIDNVQCHNPRSFVHDLTRFCGQVRAATDKPLLIGGSAFSVFPREIFRLSGADFGIQGEGETAIVELVAALRDGRSPAGIPGLIFRAGDGSIQSMPPNPADAVFTSEPHHDPEVIQAYLEGGSLPGVQTQRGCPLKCCYCTYPLIEGRRSRFRSGDEVATEMRRLAGLGVNYVFIVDSVFNTRTDHVVQVCEALIRAGVQVKWECFLRPGGRITRELLTLMQRAGLCHVEFGSDSFSDPVLKSYGKSFAWEQIRQASELAHEIGLRYSHFLIVGGPGETPATMEETLARAAQLPGAYFFATIGMRIYPGTPLWQQLAPEARGESAADYLVEPRFFLNPPLSLELIYGRLKEVQRAASNWAVGDPPPAFLQTMEKLRKRGVRGPMWEYAELIQRLQAGQTA